MQPDMHRLQVSSTGITLYSGEVGLLPPIFITEGTSRHDPPATRQDCFAGEPCDVRVTVAMYETRGGFPLQQRGWCRYAGLQGAGFGVQVAGCGFRC